jgi:hypothetical protein
MINQLVSEYSQAAAERINGGDFLPLLGKQRLAAHRARKEMDAVGVRRTLRQRAYLSRLAKNGGF